MFFIHKNNKSMLNKAFFLIIILLVLVLPFVSSAEDGPAGPALDCPVGEICNPLAVDSISELVSSVARVAGVIGFMVAALFIIYAGFLYVSARGSEEKIKKAHTTFTWAMIGTAIILGAWVIAGAIEETIKNLQ